MGKAFGVIGGFFMGFFVMICVSIIMYIALRAIVPSSTESMSGTKKKDTSDMSNFGEMPNGGTLALLGFGYFAGWIASIYFGYGFSYDTGYEDCKKEI
jgi:hypothetical protein